ncbi:MAG TPA: hypothetical protein VI844_02075 [Coxiellaceae bacterium]|nr:hypothetical protein [Coxiellaceae bacterium]
MITSKNVSGFFIVEVLIVLVLLAILTLLFLPNLQTYTDRAKFQDVIRAANSLKAAVELCGIKTGIANGGGNPGETFNLCNEGQNGIPAAVDSNYGGYVESLGTANGAIFSTSTPTFGPNGTNQYSYIIEPTMTNGIVTWQVRSVSSCLAVGLC